MNPLFCRVLALLALCLCACKVNTMDKSGEPDPLQDYVPSTTHHPSMQTDESAENTAFDASLVDDLPPDAADSTPDGGTRAPEAGPPPLGACELRYVGYGLQKDGGSFGTRKSALMCLLTRDNENIWVRGESAGTCDGDSGGPLFKEGTLEIIGLLSGSPPGCSTNEDHSTFVSIEGHRDFIDAVLSSTSN